MTLTSGYVVILRQLSPAEAEEAPEQHLGDGAEDGGDQEHAETQRRAEHRVLLDVDARHGQDAEAEHHHAQPQLVPLLVGVCALKLVC